MKIEANLIHMYIHDHMCVPGLPHASWKGRCMVNASYDTDNIYIWHRHNH